MILCEKWLLGNLSITLILGLNEQRMRGMRVTILLQHVCLQQSLCSFPWLQTRSMRLTSQFVFMLDCTVTGPNILCPPLLGSSCPCISALLFAGGATKACRRPPERRRKICQSYIRWSIRVPIPPSVYLSISSYLSINLIRTPEELRWGSKMLLFSGGTGNYTEQLYINWGVHVGIQQVWPNQACATTIQTLRGSERSAIM